MEYVNSHKLIKYSVALVIVVVLLALIPKVKMQSSDILVSALIILAIYIAIDNVLYDNPCKPKDLSGNKIDRFDVLSSINTYAQNSTQVVKDVTGKISEQATDTLNRLPSDLSNAAKLEILSIIPTINPTDVDNPLIDVQPNPPIVNRSAITSLNDKFQLDLVNKNISNKTSNIGVGMIPKIEECSTCKPNNYNDNGNNSESNILDLVNSTTTVYRPDRKYETEGSRSGVMTNEMIYTDYNVIPVSRDKTNFEYGYTFLPPAEWYPRPQNPPICVAEKSCPVCPVMAIGAPVDLKEWHESTRITPGDQVNTKYLREKLNSGR
jgi:hypothetical protein